MAFNVVKIVGRSLCLSNNNAWNHVMASGSRTLFSKSSLNLDKYELARTGHKRQLMNLEESFRSRMQDFIQKEESIIFSEDLKAMLHIVEKSNEDVDLMVKMLRKYHVQKKQLRFANFTFGPVAMRAFYYLDEPEIALQLYTDPEVETLFDQLSSGLILMDMLFNHGKYQEVLDTFRLMTKKPMPGITYPKNPAILALAACHKLNTKESFEMALDIMKESDEKSVALPRRGILFLCHLALKQNAPQITLEVLSRLRSQNYIHTRCQKIMSYAAMGRFTEILIIMRSGTALDNPASQKFAYFSDVISNLEEAMEKANMGPDTELAQLIQHVKNTGDVQNMTLEEHMFREIDNEVDLSKRVNNYRTGMYSQNSERMQNMG